MSKKGDLIAGIILALFSVFYLYEAMDIAVFAGMGKSVVDSGTVPKVWGGCLLVLSLWLIIRSLIAMKKNPEQKKGGSLVEAIKDKREVWETFGLLFFYIATMDFLGFVISSMIYIFGQIIVLSPPSKVNYKIAGILAVVFSFGIYFVFVDYLMVLLPPGLLEDL
mgnify:CR=1 FL=1